MTGLSKNKKVILMGIPMSICNLRCHYCYLAQRPVHYQGVQPEMKYSPSEVARALSFKRMGGPCFINLCADGETLLTKDLDLYVKALLEEGHFAEVVTNMTVTPVLEKMLAWDRSLLKHLEFKCSFHYLELKKKGLLERYAENVNKTWKAGASATVEITPTDELVPYIDEVIDFSMNNFGALPHLSIARDDSTTGIERLTNLSNMDYHKTWELFNSDFWRFKETIFGVKQHGFCYAGAWSAYIDLSTGKARACYSGPSLGDVFAEPDKPFPEHAIALCPIAHCYNGHALLTLGLIPGKYDTRYGDIRNRVKTDGQEWLQPELKGFFNSKLEDSNAKYSLLKKAYTRLSGDCFWVRTRITKLLR